MFVWRKISVLCLALGSAVLLLSFLQAAAYRVNILWLLLGFALLLAYVLINRLFWRCPYCKKPFEMRFEKEEQKMAVCPNCGKKLR